MLGYNELGVGERCSASRPTTGYSETEAYVIIWTQKATEVLRRHSPYVSFLVGLVILVALVSWSFRLDQFNVHVPINFQGDSVLTMNSLQNMIHGHWYFETENLGFPTGQALQDYPALADGLFVLTARLLTLVFDNPALVFNALFLMAFPLNYLGSFIGLRMLRVRSAVSVSLSVVYAVVPFNFLHGPGHVGLVWNFAIPIWLAFLIRQVSGDPLIPNSIRLFDRGLSTRRSLLVAILVGIVAGTTGFYYLVFFLLAAIPLGIREIVSRRTLRSAWILTSVFVSLMALAIQLIPIVIFQLTYGTNTRVARRSLGELAFYGLKPLGLLISAPYSHLRGITNWLGNFETNAENATSLGIVLGLVLLVSLVASLFHTRPNGVEGILTIYYLLIGLPFGGGYLLGVLGFTQLRVWSRLSIVLAVLALISLGRWITSSSVAKTNRSALIHMCLAVGLVLQIVDTVPRHQTQVDLGIVRDWQELERFTSRIERRYGAALSVFQFPIIPFPENPPVGRMTDYEHLKPYLLKPDMKFSYGGVKGRTIPWQDRLGSDPADQILNVHAAGFDAIWVDRFAWVDSVNPYEPVLAQEFGVRPTVSRSGRYAFYRLPHDLVGTSSLDAARRRRSVLAPVLASFGSGFSQLESDGTRSWRWAGKTARVELLNLSRSPKKIQLSTTIELRGEGRPIVPASCSSERLRESLVFRTVCIIDVPRAGAHLDIASTLGPIDDDDPRDLRYRVLDLELMSYAR